MNMRLLGAPTLKDVVPEMVDASSIHVHSASVPSDRLYDGNCKLIIGLKLHVRLTSVLIDESMQHARLRPLAKL